jgi:hypothetical protein
MADKSLKNISFELLFWLQELHKHKNLAFWLKTILGHQSHFYEMSMINPEKVHDLSETQTQQLVLKPL